DTWLIIPIAENEFQEVIKYKENGVQWNKICKVVNRTMFVNILVVVEQKLLNMLLEIEEQYPEESNEERALSKEQAQPLNNSVIFNIYGNNNTAQAASGNTVTQTQTVSVEKTINELRD